jgi:enoyl-CoA hydratase/carnithine racemase
VSDLELVAGVGVLRFGTGVRRNALGTGILQQIEGACDEARANGAVRALVLTGCNDFGSGIDLHPSDLLATRFAPALADAASAESLLAELRQKLECVRRVGKPTVAAIEGACFGGSLELALACDFRVCGRDATFGFPELERGLIPSLGGLVRLPRMVGLARARDMILLGQCVSGETAEAIGLVTRSVDSGRALDEGLRVANAMSKMAPRALAMGLAILDATTGESEREVRAARWAADNLSSGEPLEGVMAFFEKRLPSWRTSSS